MTFVTDEPSVGAAEGYGYSVFTTFCWPIDPQRLAAHLTRLASNAAEVGLSCTLNQLKAKWEDKRMSLLEESTSPCVVRLAIEPVVDNWRAFLGPMERWRFRITTHPLPSPSPNPLKLACVPYQRALPHLKLSGAYAEAFVLRRQVVANGFDDALWVCPQGTLTESSTSNLFVVEGNRLLTPPAGQAGCFPGITRQQVLDDAKVLGIVTVECPLTKAKLAQASAAFLTNAVSGIVAVASVDNIVFPWPEAAAQLFERLKGYNR